VLKNFPDGLDVTEAIAAAGGLRIAVAEIPYYWYVTYEVGGETSGGRESSGVA
jgi:hypothetical protein